MSFTRRHFHVPAFFVVAAFCAGTAQAQLTDLTQTPNVENSGIFKSFEQQIGAGVGNVMTPGSSSFIIARDPARAVRRGRQVFQRKFTLTQGFGPRTQDGIGDIQIIGAIGAGLIESCAGCHGRPRGSAGFGGDVVTRPDSRDAPHLFGLGLQEMLADEITTELRQIRQSAIDEAREPGARRSRAICRARASTTAPYARIPTARVDTSRCRRREHRPARAAVLRAGRHDVDSRVRDRRVQRRDGAAGGRPADGDRPQRVRAWSRPRAWC